MSALFPEVYKIVTGATVTTTNTGLNGAYISLKNAKRVIVIAELLQAATHATGLNIGLREKVGSGSAEASTAVMPVWKNANIATNDTLVRESSDAHTIAASAGVTNQLLVMEVLPERLKAGFTAIRGQLADSSEATNFATITYLIETAYPQATPPSAVA